MSTGSTQPFKSAGQTSVALTTAAVATAAAIPGDGDAVLIVNTCAVPIACDFGAVAPTVTAGSPYVVPANARMLVPVPAGMPLFAGAFPIGTASASVYFMRGNGTAY